MADALARMRAKRAERIAATLPTSRTCAGCDLCCTAPAIKEMGKPPGVRCKHLREVEPGKSCGVYASRPKVCVDFHCLWRMADHVLPEWLQPARCGFLLAFNNPLEFPSVVTVHVDPERPDAWSTPWAQTVFATLAEQWNCIVAIGQVPTTSHLFTPDGSRWTVADNPKLMMAETGKVGAPSWTFGPDRRPVAERVREVWFDWALAPPPGPSL